MEQIHTFQLSRFEREAPVLRGQLPSSRFFLKSPVLKWSWLECLIFMSFSSQLHFSQTRCKNLGYSNKIRCVRCFRPPSSSWAVDLCPQKKHTHTRTLIVFALAKEAPGSYCYIRGYSGKISQRQCEIQFPRGKFGEQKVLESAFFRLSNSLKSKILATRVPPPGYTGFIINLPFWATRRLERMLMSLCGILETFGWKTVSLF